MISSVGTDGVTSDTKWTRKIWKLRGLVELCKTRANPGEHVNDLLNVAFIVAKIVCESTRSGELSHRSAVEQDAAWHKPSINTNVAEVPSPKCLGTSIFATTALRASAFSAGALCAVRILS